MLEIRLHGRGGQGSVVAAILLAKAFFRAGYQVQSFPLFGVERRGAPVEAYLRLDREQILIRTNVYTPDHVVVQDTSLLEAIDVTRGLKPNGWIVLNSAEPPADSARYANFRLACVDATEIALRLGLGTRTHPIVNTAMMGALARVLGAPPMEAIAGAIEEEIAVKLQANIQAAREAYERVKMEIGGRIMDDGEVETK
ncbi:MAG: 2-oxoacid:acceptor oxidoreductase family protein [Syntrophobacteraceae bacterium]